MKGSLTCRYTDQDFDAEFIHILQQACQKYIDNEGEATLEEVADFIRTKVGPKTIMFPAPISFGHCIRGSPGKC